MRTSLQAMFTCGMATTCLVLAPWTTSWAQSAADGFKGGVLGAGATGGITWSIALQADGKIVVGGLFEYLADGGPGVYPRKNIGRFNADGSVDTTFNPGADGEVFTVLVQPDGKILVGGAFGALGAGATAIRNRIGRLNPDGSLDAAFDPGANSGVDVFALQPDGKILVGGAFTALGGGGTTPRSRIARLNADGSVDAAFDPGASNSVYCLVVQPDGRILVGGVFTRLGGGGSGVTQRSRLGRLHADGTIEAGFAPAMSGGTPGGLPTIVDALALQADGKILVGGSFTAIGNFPLNFIGRLNPNGAPDNFNPSANDRVESLVVQADGQIVVGGQFTTMSSTARRGIARVSPDGNLDSRFDPGTGPGISPVVTDILVQPDAKVIVGGIFASMGGVAKANMARIEAAGGLDADTNPGANGPVYALASQPDDRVVIGGFFTGLGGGTGASPRNKIGRLTVEGLVDAGFNPGASASVRAAVVQPDGRIVVGGQFVSLGGGGSGTTTRLRLGRALADGALDAAFDPGASDEIFAFARQPNGRTLVGGAFVTFGAGATGVSPRLGRLDTAGTAETAFAPGANGLVYAMAVQPDGKIVVGGQFSMLGGGGTGNTPRNRIGRLNADGSLDATFNPGANDDVYALAIQPDGKILVGGLFTTLGGGGVGTTSRQRIGRLNADGSIDPTFNPGANASVFTFALQADGGILVGGTFTTIGGGFSGSSARNRLARLDQAGTVAPWAPGADGNVYSMAIQRDGRIWVGGTFQQLGGGGTGTLGRSQLGRITAGAAATQSLVVSNVGSTVTWQRGGSAPEVQHVTFESSVDGVSYTSLGTGTRVAGGWQLAGLTLPTNQNLYIRARGGYPSGMFDGSASIVELVQQVAVMCPVFGVTSIPFGVPGVSYATSLTAPGGVLVLTGTLPPGLSFVDGRITGTPTQAGVFPVTLTATHASSGCVSTRTYSLPIYTAPSLTSISPGSGPLTGGTIVTVTGAGFVSGQTSLTIGGTAATNVAVTSPNTLVATSPAGPAGAATVVVTTPVGSPSLVGAFTYTTSTTYTRFLAEGATSTFFDTRLAILNPGPATTLATLTFARAGAAPIVTTVLVSGRTRVTLNPKGIAGLDRAEFSTKVESDQPLVVDRTMSWDAGGYGAHAETAVSAPALTWYLAEGSTVGGFNLFYLLQNPNGVDVQVRVRYLRPSGVPIEKTYLLPATSRTNIWVNQEDFAGLGRALAGTDVSAVIEVLDGPPIIVERAMYLNLPGQTFGAGHGSAGVTSPATQWFLAEGATGPFFDLFVLIANPGDVAAPIQVTYLLPDGTTIAKSYSVAANSRFTIWVDYEDPLLANTAVSTTVRSLSDVPVIVERAMWWPGTSSQWYEAHNSPGATTTGTRWALAEGEVGGDRNVDTYILLANTSAASGAVKVTLLFEDGTSAERTFTVAGNSRFNVDARSEFAQALNRRFGAIVESLGTAPVQVIVERAMYWNAGGQTWAAGTNSLATRLP